MYLRIVSVSSIQFSAITGSRSPLNAGGLNFWNSLTLLISASVGKAGGGGTISYGLALRGTSGLLAAAGGGGGGF